MNEAVVRFDLANTWCYATFRGLQSIHENKANPLSKKQKQKKNKKGWNQGSFVYSEGKILSYHQGAIYIKLYKPSSRGKKEVEDETGGRESYSNHK